ncbi:hypothetical protein QBC38DRAFT_214513 [Podospora fimiseda]|uniref:Glucan 4-alpha-glucosidase n=1 Tax=Podospora fimiseda TaxID=252190 RepID=A0AAN7GXX5_9PEZI|nr:hypothetical protein QBC38DRAFT_214513 [Podospora fimiseda]
MSPPAKEDDASPSKPTTPKNASAKSNGAKTPKSAGSGSAGTAAPPKKKIEPPPSLLTDFLLGRPSPARVAAQREALKQRRKSMAADAAHVREELRKEMRAAAVRRLQQPNTVTDRVKSWQKNSAAAMKAEGGGPPRAESVATAPTDFAAQVAAESVTEEDRVRIKLRKSKKRKPKANKGQDKKSDGVDDEGDEEDGDGEETEKENAAPKHPPAPARDAPKKRIVSDDNWMKRAKAKIPIPAQKPKVETGPVPIPKDFLQRTAQNPTVQNKIKEWAKRVEPPDPEQLVPPKIHLYRHPKSGGTITVEEDAPSVVTSDPGFRHTRTKSAPTFDDGIRVKPLKPQKSDHSKKSDYDTDDGIRVKPLKPKKPDYNTDDDGIRVYPLRKKEPADDGIRVRPTESEVTQSTLPDDGIRVRPTESEVTESTLPDDGIRVRPTDSSVTGSSLPDDGIRVRPTESTATGSSLPDDGIRVKPLKTTPLPDDGIRVRPMQPDPVEETAGRSRGSRHVSKERIPRGHSVRRDRSRSRERLSRGHSTRRQRSPDNVIEVIEDEETVITTPPKRKATGRRKPKKSRSASPVIRASRPEDYLTEPEHVYPETRHEDSGDESDRVPPTVLGNKSLADIPVGYSAFSVLDLPLGADARNSVPKKPKAQRNPSFKAMPKVLKKVVTGAREIIQDMSEPPPRTAAANQPQSIESWLNKTVDPFVEAGNKPENNEKPSEPEKQARASPKPAAKTEPLSEKKQKETAPAPIPASAPVPIPTSAPRSSERKHRDEDTNSSSEDSDVTAKKSRSPPARVPSGLQRRRATRGSSSPVKSTGKKPFREILKDAFRGESTNYKMPPTVYPSCEASEYDEESYYDDDEDYHSEHRSERRCRPQSPSNSYYSSTYESTLSSDISSHGPQRRKPPTNGVHELSTIVSEEASAVDRSETMSTISHTTLTQAAPVSRQQSQKSGLKRRLTKHSDLVSVLSLPDDNKLVAPSRSRSIKSSNSLHRRPSKVDRSRINELLDEFADDEHFYKRELKTLVDGVIPVLLTHLAGGGDNIAHLLNRGGAADPKSDAVTKSVINMGVVLERLKNFHKEVPLDNMYDLLNWLQDVSPIYDNYFDVWRLGFQGLIINLAPKYSQLDDNDSLLNALPLNEDGDVIGENGERVDVAFLLKRPLIRVKWMTKFLRAASLVIKTSETQHLLSVFEGLQEKSRKRHREENARMTDEDANNTDTTRVRDLRTLLPLEGICIDRTRQVAALDVFALDLNHSNGQRLECQIEIIHRDIPGAPAHLGDILIREVGNNARSWLLFPPVPMPYISARRSENDRAMVVMIRGTHNGIEWYELLNMSTVSEEQIDFWLDVLGSNPVPPMTRRRPTSTVMMVGSPKSDHHEIPVGERKPTSDSSDNGRPRTPSRYRPRSSQGSPSPDKLPSRATFPQYHGVEDRTSRPPPNSTPFREDGAPPPPIHRTLSNKLAPPIELKAAPPIKRRGSSPLKHEYHPSDVSSDESGSVTEDSESSESSSDDLDEDEVPDTIPGYSLRKPHMPAAAESVVSDSSITPSHSASQVGYATHDGQRRPERPTQKFVAKVSYWTSKKGQWKDMVGGSAASIWVHPGCMEVHQLNEHHTIHQAYPLQSSGTSEVDNATKDAGSILPLVGLILTPVVMIRRSTALDLEVRTIASPESRLKTDSGMFRFRTATQEEGQALYEAVHLSRLNNARYIQLAEEARFRSFGQTPMEGGEGSADGDSSCRRRGWLGRKNSYRASTRAPPSVSQGSMSTTVSAGSFLRRLMGGLNNTFNIEESTVDKNSSRGGGAGHSSFYMSSADSSGEGGGGTTPPRSVSLSGSGSRWSNGLSKPFSPDQPLEIRCHLNVQNNRWLDKGDCILHITRPPPGVKQELQLYHGLEKRVIVTKQNKKTGDKPVIMLDAVLGSKCFSMLGRKGVMCSVWEQLRDEDGNVGVAPANGALSGKVTKWCFQCKNFQQAEWIMKMVTAEVEGLMM